MKIFHNGSTVNSIYTSIYKCWDKTHGFIQVFEALFRYQIEMHMEYRKNDEHNNNFCTKSCKCYNYSERIPLLKSKPENINDQLIEQFVNPTSEFYGFKLLCAKYSNNHNEADTKTWLQLPV